MFVSDALQNRDAVCKIRLLDSNCVTVSISASEFDSISPSHFVCCSFHRAGLPSRYFAISLPAALSRLTLTASQLRSRANDVKVLQLLAR